MRDRAVDIISAHHTRQGHTGPRSRDMTREFARPARPAHAERAQRNSDAPCGAVSGAPYSSAIYARRGGGASVSGPYIHSFIPFSRVCAHATPRARRAQSACARADEGGQVNTARWPVARPPPRLIRARRTRVERSGVGMYVHTRARRARCARAGVFASLISQALLIATRGQSTARARLRRPRRASPVLRHGWQKAGRAVYGAPCTRTRPPTAPARRGEGARRIERGRACQPPSADT